MRVGVKERLAAWCQARGIEAPKLRSNNWRSVLPKRVVYTPNMKARQVRGLAWRESDDLDKGTLVSRTWYGLEWLTCLLHAAAVFTLPILTILHALVLQNMHGLYLAPADGIDGKRPLIWNDAYTALSGGGIKGEPLAGNTYSVPIVALLVAEQLTFICASLVRLLLFYAAPEAPRLVKAVR